MMLIKCSLSLSLILGTSTVYGQWNFTSNSKMKLSHRERLYTWNLSHFLLISIRHNDLFFLSPRCRSCSSVAVLCLCPFTSCQFFCALLLFVLSLGAVFFSHIFAEPFVKFDSPQPPKPPLSLLLHCRHRLWLAILLWSKAGLAGAQQPCFVLVLFPFWQLCTQDLNVPA